MGLLDDVVGKVLGGGQAGSQSALLGSLMNAFAGQGGLAALVKTFSDKGLGDVVSSWVGTGANQPISAQQIQHALGSQQIQQLAQQHGLSTDAVASALSQALPGVVDKLTPGGKLPDAGALQGLLKGLLG
jgi:uncharacterized protein YidB (DUF937 family)